MIGKVMGSVRRHGVREFFRRVIGYAQWFWARHIRRAPYMVRQVHMYRMALDLSDPGISTTLAKGILREKDQVLVVKRELAPGMTVLDIGANIGYYALLEASLVGPEGHVYALEPVPCNYELLKKNVVLNGFEGIIETFPLAASDADKTETFYLSDHSNLGSFFKDNLATGGSLAYMSGENIHVQVVDIGRFLKDKKKIDMIRMDIEGAEVEVFRGILPVLDAHRPLILFETHRSRYHPETHDIAGPLRALFAKGYQVKTLISNEDNVRWHDRGYRAETILRTDGVRRGLYGGVRREDAIDIVCNLGGVRAVLLAPAG